MLFSCRTSFTLASGDFRVCGVYGKTLHSIAKFENCSFADVPETFVPIGNVTIAYSGGCCSCKCLHNWWLYWLRENTEAALNWRVDLEISMSRGASSILEYQSPSVHGGLRNWEEVILEFRDIEHIVQDSCPSTIIRNLNFPNSHCRQAPADSTNKYGPPQSLEFEELPSIRIHMMSSAAVLDPAPWISSDWGICRCIECVC